MRIELFPYNQSAYEAVLQMLSVTGKACVIHPTGTGKSFIAFKYCEDHPEQSVLWLSPSEYIFKTQRENLTATGAAVPGNITFMTYAKLSRLEAEELSELHCDAVIMDEMHRAAAPTWEKPVQSLIRQNPKASLIGLTATHIRYLDNLKDTAKLFFDDCIASYLTLGEAILRGILHAPRYVLTSFRMEESLQSYERRIRRAKSAQVRDEGEKFLDALRRALEKADGLDRVFQKNLTDIHGKYLAFCADIEHLNEMLSHVPEWFGKIDAEAHVYHAYADDPASSQAFQAFKEDHSDHLKLLFSIDMLNEGVHVEDVSGVILFRPTVSPIIYKQQIGRALSASKSKEPVIFDVVNNIENLYSVGTVEQEMRDALFLLRDRGKAGQIVTERFQVTDELLDCRELFARLDETLTASWQMFFQCARHYYEERGNLLVPRRYRTPEGYALGNWILTQRKVRAGRQYGKLDETRIALLDSIGMVWEDMTDVSWNRYYAALCAYREKHGNLDIKADYIDENGLTLGSFITNLRASKQTGRRSRYLTKEHIAALDALGMIWDRLDYAWEQNYQASCQYYVRHHDLRIPNAYVTDDGLRIGTWIRRQRMIRDGRAEGVLTPERIRRLDDIGMVWTDAFTSRWNYGYEQARKWYETHGNLDVPATYVNENGFPLGKWLKRQTPDQSGKTQTKLTPERRKKLAALGFSFEMQQDSWDVRYALARQYYEEHGTLQMPGDTVVEGIWLAKWINEQRQIYIGNRPGKVLTEEQIQKLNAVGMEWENRKERMRSAVWQKNYEAVKEYYEANGNLNIPKDASAKDGTKLHSWLLRQRQLKKAGKLTDEQVSLLSGIGMEWELQDPWENGFTHAEAFYKEHHHLRVPNGFVSEDGFRLGAWITNQRSNRNKPSQYHFLTEEQKVRLESIGMVWCPSKDNWIEGYHHAKTYLQSLHGAPWKTTYQSDDGYQTGNWLYMQKRRCREGKISSEKRKMLEEIGLFSSEHENARETEYFSLKPRGNGAEIQRTPP